MATCNYIDLTDNINEDDVAIIDVGGYKAGTVFVKLAAGTVTFSTSNDGGEEDGTVLGSALTAENFNPCILLNVETGLSASVFASTGMYKFENIGKYLKIETSAGADSVIVQLYKII